MIRVLKKTVLYFLIFLGASFLFWVGYLVAGGRDAAVIMYHAVGEGLPPTNTINISEEAFGAQMDFLHHNGYRVIPLGDLVELLKSKKPIPPKTVVITFDDGYEDTYTKVFPVLKKYRFPATVFLISNFLDKERALDGGTFKFMTRTMAKEMAASGLVTIGSHTRSHHYLPHIRDEAALYEEIAGSKKALEVMLGRPVEFFCYPIGGVTPRVQRYVREAGYVAAVTTLPRHHSFAHRDIFALKRIKMTERARHPFILFVQLSGYYLRMKEMSR